MVAGTLEDPMPVGTLDGIVPARVALMGNLDGAGLVSTVGSIAPGGFELVGNLEGTVLTSAVLAGTLVGIRVVGEGAELVVIELAGTSASLGQMVALA